MFCKSCGNIINEKDLFCSNCGKKKEFIKCKNSKFGLFWAIGCNLLIFLSFVWGIIFVFKFESPDIIQSDDLKQYMRIFNCEMLEMEQVESYIGADSYFVTEDDCPYFVSYAIFSDIDKQNSFMTQTFKEVGDNGHITGGSKTNINNKFWEYSTIGDSYKKVVMNKNSILTGVSSTHKRFEVKKLFESFGYEYEPNWSGFKFLGYALLIWVVLYLVSMVGILQKTRNKGWIALIPLYNIWCLSKDILGRGWYCLLFLLPIGNFAFKFLLSYKLGKSFGKSLEYCILLCLFSSIVWPLVAFDNSKYINLK